MAALIYIKCNEQISTEFRNILQGIFTHCIINGAVPHPYVTCKTFSVLLAIGKENEQQYKDLKRQNQFYTTYYYDEIPKLDSFLFEIQKIQTVYMPNNPSSEEHKPATVIVFDLDDTLITPDYQLFYKNIWKDLKLYAKTFDYVILWTHATEDYLHRRLESIDFEFHLYMSRQRDISTPPGQNKGLAAVLRALNQQYNVRTIKFAVLVDDRYSNFNNDYDCFLLINSEPTDGFYAKAHALIYKTLVNYKNGNEPRILEAKSI